MANTSTGRTARLNTRITPEVMQRLNVWALTRRISVASAVNQLLDDVLPPLPDPHKRTDRP